MQKLRVDGKEIPVWVDTVDGKPAYFIAERSSRDGGIVTSVLVEAPDGTSTLSRREWRGCGTHKIDERSGQTRETTVAEREAAQEEALAAFNALSREEIERRARLAAAGDTSGGIAKAG